MPGRARHHLDRLLVLGAAVLLVAIAWDAITARPHHRSTRTAASPVAPPPAAAPVPASVRLVPSSTAFLPLCPRRDLRLSVGPGPLLTLRFAGSRCHLPPLRLQATLRAGGKVVYRGPALAHEDLSGNYAVSGSARGRLLGCDRGSVIATVTGSGLTASAPIRCS